MNKFWNWKLFGILLMYYLIVLSLFIVMQVFNFWLYIVFSLIFAAICTFINSNEVEEAINNFYYSINDMLFKSIS